MSDTPSTPNRFCLGCGYSLRGLIDPRCPECGKPFDPNDPKTWSPRPLQSLAAQRAQKAVDGCGVVFFWGCAIPLFLLLIVLMAIAAYSGLAPVFGR